MASLEHIDHVEDKGFIRNCSERTLIYARAAGNALIVINASLLFLAHINCFDLARLFARALIGVDSVIGADL